MAGPILARRSSLLRSLATPRVLDASRVLNDLSLERMSMNSLMAIAPKKHSGGVNSMVLLIAESPAKKPDPAHNTIRRSISLRLRRAKYPPAMARNG